MPSALFPLAQALGQALLAHRAHVATAESCTGGGIAAALTAVAGSSQWFEMGFVTYSYRAKAHCLGLHLEALQRHGAVRAEVAAAMAEAARRQSGADYAIATTGIAGPHSDEHNTPVGCVWVAWASAAGTDTQCFQFHGTRHSIQQASIRAALEGLLQRLPAR